MLTVILPFFRMRKLFLSTAVAGMSILAVSLAAAQNVTTACGETDAANVKVKETCTGRIETSYNDKRCLVYTCVVPPVETVACPDSNTNYVKVNETCIGGRIVSYHDENKCLLYKCVPNSTGSCAEADAYNEKVKETCKGTVTETKDGKGCMWLRCKEEPVKPAVAPQTARVQCFREGCTVKCGDGGIYNVCGKECPRVVPVPTANQTGMTGTAACKRTKDGNCWIVRCGDSVKRECPPAVACTSVREGKCIVKKCTDGTVKRDCPK
jgi:hypothetical protein